MSDSAPAIETRALGKVYGRGAVRVRAVEHLDLIIRSGEIFGLLGPNGAGKTTTLRMLCGLLDPTEGEALVCGTSVTRDPERARSLIGLVPGEAGNLRALTAEEELAYYGAFYDLDAAAVRERSRPLLERLGLAPRSGERVETFSKGMRRKLHLVRAFLPSPRVLILDEPTAGLDPAVVEEVWAILREEARERGTTVLFSSHQLEEVERLCDRVAILNVRLLAEGTLADLAGRRRRYRVTVRSDAAPLVGAVSGIAGVEDAAADGATLSFRPDGAAAEIVPEVVRRLVAAGADILGVEPEGDLRTLYRSIVMGKDLGGAS